MPSEKHPARILLGLLDVRGRRRVAFVALTLLVERLTVTASAILLSSRGVDATLIVVVALGAVVLLRSAARSLLALHVRGQVATALATALLSTHAGERANADAELSTVDGMYAAEEILRQRLPDLLGDTPACLILAAFVIWREPWLLVLEWGAVIVAGGAVVALVRGLAASHFQQAWRAFLPALDDLMTAIHARREVVGNGDEGRLLASLARKLDAWKARSRSASMVSFLAGRAPAVAAAAVAGLVLLEGGWRGLSLTWLAVLATVVPPFAGVARGSLDIGRDLIRAKPVLEALQAAAPARREGRIAVTLPASVFITGVSFSYEGSTTPSLQGVDLVWTPGSLFGLAGRNGSGKTTLVLLLLGLLRPTEGQIRIGDVDVQHADMPQLRQRCAYLAQSPYLADRTSVIDAIRERAPEATPGAIQQLLTRLGLFAVLERRQKSAPLEVTVGALSVGERQRVALARILLRDASMLLLDEPDANLDAEGIAVVGELLREQAKTRMVLVIAHSPAMLAYMDRVLHFEDGRIREA
jgi:ABC-type multidrug transport system fused ATPase/permease subunit